MAIETKTSVDVQTLPPFKRFIMSIGALPTSYLESMSYAELLMWFCNFLQEQVIPAVNNNADAIREIQDFLNTLDLQDEVDNKLDEMAESGQLADIISQYLNSTAIFGYDSVADMAAADNLVSGSYARTTGYYLPNDLGGALYSISDTQNSSIYQEDLGNGLYANIILGSTVTPEQFGAYGDEIHDDYIAIENAIKYGKKIMLNKTYICNHLIEIEKNNITLCGKGSIKTTLPVLFDFNLSNNINIEDLTIISLYDNNLYEGVREATADPNGYTTLSPIIGFTDCYNVNLLNLTVNGGYTCIYAKTSKNVYINKCEISGARHICLCLSTSQFIVENNKIHDIDCDYVDQYANYLIQATDNSGLDNQKYSTIKNNILYNNKNWDAIMMHIYNNIMITDNHIYEVRSGIDLSAITLPEGDPFVYKNVIITNNIIEGTSTDIDPSFTHLNVGITFTSVEQNIHDVVISNNMISNFGIFNSPTHACIEIHGGHHFNITNNILKNLQSSSNQYACCLLFIGECDNVNINGNILHSIQWITRIERATITNLNISGNENNCVNGCCFIDGSSAVSNFSFTDYNGVGNSVRANAGAVVNGITYSANNINLFYTKPENKYYETTFNTTLSANQSIRTTLTIGAANSGDMYLVTASGANSDKVLVRATYGSSTNIFVTYTNLTNEEVTPNLAVKIIRYHN